jgi:uncharacterized protein YkwD
MERRTLNLRRRETGVRQLAHALARTTLAIREGLQDVNALEERFFGLTHWQRARRWLRPLAEDAALSDAARRHSQDML